MLKWWWDGALAVECRRPWAPPRGGNCPHPRTNHHRYHWNFWSKKREQKHIFVPKLLYCASNHAFQAFLAKEQFIHQLTEGPPLHKREKGCEFELTPLKRVFPKQSMEPWVIYFCFGQEGTPTLSAPTPWPHGLWQTMQLARNKLTLGPEIMTKNTNCRTINYRFKQACKANRQIL